MARPSVAPVVLLAACARRAHAPASVSFKGPSEPARGLRLQSRHAVSAETGTVELAF